MRTTKTIRRVLRIGGSWGITLPPEWLRSLGLSTGSEIELTFGDGVIYVEPVRVKEVEDGVRDALTTEVRP